LISTADREALHAWLLYSLSGSAALEPSTQVNDAHFEDLHIVLGEVEEGAPRRSTSLHGAHKLRQALSAVKVHAESTPGGDLNAVRISRICGQVIEKLGAHGQDRKGGAEEPQGIPHSSSRPASTHRPSGEQDE
jgi:hypothetical protein